MKSRDNAVKSGIYASKRLLHGEDKDLYAKIRKEQLRLFKPKTYVARALVDQLVGDLWTLRRVVQAEVLAYHALSEEVRHEMIEPMVPQAQFHDAGKVGKLAEAYKKAYLEKNMKPIRYERWPVPAFERLLIDEQKHAAMLRFSNYKRHLVNNILSLEKELLRRTGED